MRLPWPRGSTCSRVVVASSQAAMGEGLYRCAEHGEQTPDMPPGGGPGTVPLGSDLPGVRRAAGAAADPGADLQPAERVRHVEVRRGNGRDPPGSPLRNSRRWRCATASSRAPGSRCTTPTPGACRIFNLHYLLGGAPALYEDGQAIRDYVNIHDVVDANVLALTEDRAAGRVFNVGGGTGYTTAEFAEIVRRQYGSERAAADHRRVPVRRHPAYPLRHRRAEAARLVAAAHACRLGRRVRRRGSRACRDWTRSWPRPTRRCARWASSERPAR